MAAVNVTSGFGEDLEAVTSARVHNAILGAVKLLESFPERGSTDVPESVRYRYGDVRKIVVRPFDVVYRYSREDDVVYVLGLVPCRRAY